MILLCSKKSFSGWQFERELSKLRESFPRICVQRYEQKIKQQNFFAILLLIPVVSCRICHYADKIRPDSRTLKTHFRDALKFVRVKIFHFNARTSLLDGGKGLGIGAVQTSFYGGLNQLVNAHSCPTGFVMKIYQHIVWKPYCGRFSSHVHIGPFLSVYVFRGANIITFCEISKVFMHKLLSAPFLAGDFCRGFTPACGLSSPSGFCCASIC